MPKTCVTSEDVVDARDAVSTAMDMLLNTYGASVKRTKAWKQLKRASWALYDPNDSALNGVLKRAYVEEDAKPADTAP